MPGVLADVQAANASLDQTVQKKKFRNRQESRSDIMTSTSIKGNPTTTQSDLRNAFDEWLDGLDTDHPTLTTHSLKAAEESLWRWDDVFRQIEVDAWGW